jgi:hypothetical protein
MIVGNSDSKEAIVYSIMKTPTIFDSNGFSRIFNVKKGILFLAHIERMVWIKASILKEESY